MKTTVIIPTYNESKNIGPLIEEILSTVPSVEILVVDDNSPDGTAYVVRTLIEERPSVKLLERPRKEGLGAAYIEAFKMLLNDQTIDCIVTMDGDFSHDPKHLPAILAAAQNADLVIGSRYIHDGGIAEWEMWRRQLSYWANMYVRAILRKPIADWTTGYQCIRTAALRRINLGAIDLSGYAFLQELKYILTSGGASFLEVPIIFQARRGGESKISGFIIREGIIGPWKIRKKI
jgi:dolichol-phosphate mannosyltransferase